MVETAKRYLGDGVYASWDGMHVVLTTENAIGARNIIYLDDQVIAALERYYNALKTGEIDLALCIDIGQCKCGHKKQVHHSSGPCLVNKPSSEKYFNWCMCEKFQPTQVD